MSGEWCALAWVGKELVGELLWQAVPWLGVWCGQCALNGLGPTDMASSFPNAGATTPACASPYSSTSLNVLAASGAPAITRRWAVSTAAV